MTSHSTRGQRTSPITLSEKAIFPRKRSGGALRIRAKRISPTLSTLGSGMRSKLLTSREIAAFHRTN